jgi:hypothetical protein
VETWTITELGGKVNNPKFHNIVAQTRAAIADLPIDFSRICWGSQCLVLEDSSVWILDNTATWVEI